MGTCSSSGCSARWTRSRLASGPRLRVLLRGAPPQRRGRPAAHVRRGVPRAQARRAAADGQRDAQDHARPARACTIEGVEQYEGYEHAHWAWRYRWEATRAGFLTEVTEPHYRAFFGDATLQSAARRAGAAGGGPPVGLCAAPPQPRAAGVPGVVQPRVGRGLDEHGRDQVAALRRAARGLGDRPARCARARRCGALAQRSPQGPGASAAAAYARGDHRDAQACRRVGV